MVDSVGIAGGASNEPGLPPINLPSFDAPQPRPRPRIEITAPPPSHPDGAAALLPEFNPVDTAVKGEGAAATLPDFATYEAPPPARQTTVQEAQLGGLKNAYTFGTAPAIAGAAEASGYQAPDMTTPHEAQTLSGLIEDPGAAAQHAVEPLVDTVKYLGRPFVGAAKLLINSIKDHPDPEVQDAYERGRRAALENENLQREQHPAAFLTGQLFGGLTGPAFGATAKAATLAGRVFKGMRAGAIGGGLYGGGTALSEGEDASGVAGGAVQGAVIGAPIGGVLGGAFGPRVAKTNTPGQQATRTAESLGAPLPKGLASDSPFVQATTQQAAQIPVVGGRVGKRAAKTVEAAGQRIEDIAGDLAPSQSRAIADARVRAGLEGVIDDNKGLQNAAYNDVRARIDQGRRFSMPRTKKMLDKIKQERRDAGWEKPEEGLQQYENVAAGTTFNGAQRASSDARNAGNPLAPNPGYDANDFNRLTGMMKLDVRDIVSAAATGDRKAAVRAFDRAEEQFGALADENKLLQQLHGAKGEAAISAVLGAAKEKSGNLGLLAKLRGKMAPAQFQQISSTLLNELGHSPKTGEFSLNQFATSWDKLSDGAKNVLFSPAHRKEIDDIVQLGQQLKGGDQYRNTSNTAGAIILWDVVRAVGEGAIAAAAGYVSPGAMIAAGGTAVTAELLTRYLASPAKAAAIGAWVRAYRAVTLSGLTPARQATFVIATRNLGHALGIPANDIGQIIQRHLPLAAQPSDQGAPEEPYARAM